MNGPESYLKINNDSEEANPMFGPEPADQANLSLCMDFSVSLPFLLSSLLSFGMTVQL